MDEKVTVEVTPPGDPALSDIADQFVQHVYDGGGPVLKRSGGNPWTGTPAVRFSLDKNTGDNSESYRLSVTVEGIDISSPTYNGCYYGLQTLLQLLPVSVFGHDSLSHSSWKVPCLNISDHPRFPYRGMHLDVARHFYPVPFIKKFIDLMAMHKLNYFHWHLTDDQGWRIEIRKYPDLTRIGSTRPCTIREPYQENDPEAHAGFYTREEIREVVTYAAKKYITIVPEIETPSHASAALASYPELGCRGNGYAVSTKMGVIFDDGDFCAGRESTFTFLEGVLDEVIDMFPGLYIHIGGDECPMIMWKECPYCQARIRDEGLKDETELQAYFVQRLEKYVEKKGRMIIGWDEILQGNRIMQNAVVMSWRGNESAVSAARKHLNVIMSPTTPLYFIVDRGSSNTDSITMSFIKGFNTLDSVYNYDPIPAGLGKAEAKHIIGLQACTWTEFMKEPEIVESMVFPRICALSEVQWLDQDKKDLADFKNRLRVHLSRLDNLHVNYARHPL